MLAELMALIAQTQVHYIRCVKPNPKSVSAEFDNALVAEQLRCAGALDAAAHAALSLSSASSASPPEDLRELSSLHLLARGPRAESKRLPPADASSGRAARAVSSRRADAVATEAEIEQMCVLTRDALRAGALGFTSSRTHVHVGGDGRTVPGTVAGP